jgi:AcrR family transcriptional regulator
MEKKKRERSGRILDAAFKCFNAKGFKNTTMAMIADEADMSVGSLYNYHGSKEELLLNGIFSSREGFAREIADLAVNDLTYEERWLKLTGIYLASFSQYGKRVWREFMAAVFSDAPERIRDIEQIDLPFTEGIMDILRANPTHDSSPVLENNAKYAGVIYQLWLQKILQYMLSESISSEELQSSFLEDLRTIGVLD